jgi:GTP cyclohydrolase I
VSRVTADVLDGHHPAAAVPADRVPAAATAAAAMLLDALGIDTRADGLEATPARFAAALAELTCGLRGPDPGVWLERTFPPGGPHPSMITVTGLEFSSVCEHHLLPFYGTAAVGYLPAPGARVVGVSKLSRLVTSLAARPQMQERLGQQVVDTIEARLATQGAACLITATHLCMTMRGARAGLPARMVTNHLTGRFLNEQSVRAEFLTLTAAP